MPELDYRTVIGESSVADEVQFDTWLRDQSDQVQRLVLLKIKHEVAEGDHALRLGEIEDEIVEHIRDTKKAELRAEQAETRADAAERDVDALKRDITDLEHNLSSLRMAIADAEIRHGRELDEAEVRGYQRALREQAENAA